jgi:hypothetical protein
VKEAEVTAIHPCCCQPFHPLIRDNGQCSHTPSPPRPGKENLQLLPRSKCESPWVPGPYADSDCAHTQDISCPPRLGGGLPPHPRPLLTPVRKKLPCPVSEEGGSFKIMTPTKPWWRQLAEAVGTPDPAWPLRDSQPIPQRVAIWGSRGGQQGTGGQDSQRSLQPISLVGPGTAQLWDWITVATTNTAGGEEGHTCLSSTLCKADVNSGSQCTQSQGPAVPLHPTD